MTPEQCSVMERMSKGEYLSTQSGGFKFEAAWFGDQTPVEGAVFQSLIKEGWIDADKHEGTITNYAVTALGKAAFEVEALYMIGSTDVAASKLRDAMIKLRLRCYAEIHESEKYAHMSDESGPVLARDILAITAPKII